MELDIPSPAALAATQQPKISQEEQEHGDDGAALLETEREAEISEAEEKKGLELVEKGQAKAIKSLETSVLLSKGSGLKREPATTSSAAGGMPKKSKPHSPFLIN